MRSKLPIKTPERRHQRVSIVNFEQVVARWDSKQIKQAEAMSKMNRASFMLKSYIDNFRCFFANKFFTKVTRLPRLTDFQAFKNKTDALLDVITYTRLPQKKLTENPGLSWTLFLIFQVICFINSRNFPGFFKKYQ